jgi:hypothetical protein
VKQRLLPLRERVDPVVEQGPRPQDDVHVAVAVDVAVVPVRALEERVDPSFSVRRARVFEHILDVLVRRSGLLN